MNAAKIPDKARAVIIGGGVVGCSIAYHLARLGWDDVILLERKRLTSGTTWHAAGLIAQLRATANMTRLAKYSQELYGSLEQETGVATGFVRCGSITVALTEARREELLRSASMARSFGVEIYDLSPEDIKKQYPYLNPENVVSGVYLPKDGQGDPANIAMALAKGARQLGAGIFENTMVTGMTGNNRRINTVKWSCGGQSGSIETEHVVNCAGMWARDVGRMAGADVPLHACEHFYIVTEPIEGMWRLPVLRVPDEYAYYKEDAGKILLGAFEPDAKPWGMEGIPEEFEFDQLPEDFDHFEPVLEKAINRFPMLETVGIHTFFNGPESFTPDNAYLLGPAPGLDNFFVAAGFNSVGIQSAGGAGMALAQWMEDDEKPFDLGDVDISRMHPFQNNRLYLKTRATEALGLLYADHFPYRQKDTARGVRRSPFHDKMLANRAVMGEVAGWERPNWFARQDQEREYLYRWGRQNWFDNWAEEHQAVRSNIGMYDMSSFGKIQVAGPDAEDFLNHVCGNNLSVANNRIVYTQFLNGKGGIEADVTITRLSTSRYLVVTPAATLHADLERLERHSGNHSVVLTDVTSAEGVLAVMGPNARKLLQMVTSADLSNESFPFATSRTIELGMARVRAHRISYVGELGWEIYVSSDMCGHVFETLMDVGRTHDLRLCGMHMMDSCRSEKAYRHFGHDITSEDHVLEAGLGFAVRTSKPDFIGRDAVLAKREDGLERMLLQFRLLDPNPLLYHNEPILRDGEIVSFLTSGSYGHHLGSAIGLGYVPCSGESTDDLLSSRYDIEVAGKRHEAFVSATPMYDATGSNTRS